MFEMFRLDISLSVEGGSDPPTTTTDSAERAYRAENRLDQLKEMMNLMHENKRKQNNPSSNQNKTTRGREQSGEQGYSPVSPEDEQCNLPNLWEVQKESPWRMSPGDISML